MAELLDGNGSSYPSSIDTNNDPAVDNVTLIAADHPNDLAAAIIAVQTELGTDPAGSQTNVKTRISNQHSTAGAHSTSSVVTSGDTQLITSNKVFTKLNFEATDTGSANAYAFALNGSLAAYTDGLEVRGRVANTNTGTSTIAVNGLSAEIIWTPNGVALVGQELKAGGIYVWIFDGTNSKWILQNGGVSRVKVSGNDTTPGFLNGKLVEGEGLDLTENSDGGNETLSITPRTMKVFTSSGTFTQPNGVTVVRVLCVGCGGGGGSGTGANPGGGGGGAAVTDAFVTISGDVTVTIGTAGAGGTGGGVGGNGGNTTFGALATALGGTGGNGGATGTGGAGGLEGTFIAGDILRIPGITGSDFAGTAGGDGNGNGYRTLMANQVGGAGGAQNNPGVAAVGNGDGGGGGGLGSSTAGGAGATGYCIVTY